MMNKTILVVAVILAFASNAVAFSAFTGNKLSVGVKNSATVSMEYIPS